MEKWYAAWIPTGQEEQVKAACDRKLGNLNIYEECFLPKYEKPWKENGVWIKKLKVLFPGYLFFYRGSGQAVSSTKKNSKVYETSGRPGGADSYI